VPLIPYCAFVMVTVLRSTAACRCCSREDTTLLTAHHCISYLDTAHHHETSQLQCTIELPAATCFRGNTTARAR
ncbi:hypothetical protein COO60DRAFT_1482194, partial [Scenedesmus sp. NREL 46B-D3]